MPEPPEHPVGIEGIEALYRECRQRAGSTRRRLEGDLPVIVLVGRRGNGKTAVLKWLRHRGSRRPCAMYDFRDAGAVRPHEVARQIAFGLSQRLHRQPPLHFPRLQLGLLAVAPGLTLDGSDARLAGAQLREALRRDEARGQFADQVSNAVGFLQELNLLPVPGVAFAAGLLLRGRSVLPPRAVWRTGLAWYSRHRQHAPLDALVHLNKLSRSTSPADLAEVDEQLCRAFLADLRADYRRGRRDRNCTVLLDNVDSPGGRPFLDLLVRLRDTDAQDGLDPDPLVVLATASTIRRVPGVSSAGPGLPRIRQAEAVSYRDWADSRPARPHDSTWRWYPVQLPDLTAAEVSRLGARLAPRLPEATPLVHRLTYGHPWSVHLLHGAVSEIIGQGGGDPELRRILEREVEPQDGEGGTGAPHAPHGTGAPHGAGGTGGAVRLEQYALHHLLQDLGDQQRRALVLCSAAREFDTATDAGLLTRFTEQTQRTLGQEVRSRLWLVDPVPEDAGTRGGRGSGYLLGPAAPHLLSSGPVMHTWLRLLLLGELAGLPDSSPLNWTTAHEQLCGWHRDHDRPVDALYHRLALGGLDEVVEHLSARMWELPGTAAWLYELYAVTAAPMRRPVDPELSAAERADALARELAPRSFRDSRSLAVLTAALWLAADPRNRLPNAAPELNYTISSMFLELAVTSDARIAGLRHEAARYDVHM